MPFGGKQVWRRRADGGRLTLTVMLRTALLALFAAGTCLAQAPSPAPRAEPPLAQTAESSPPPKSDAETLRDIVNDARATPVEIFAEIALREVSGIPSKDQTQALEDVFSRAGEAHDPLPLRFYVDSPPIHISADSPIHPNAREANLVSARLVGLDALSIRCRVAQAMLRINPKRARELFEAIPPPDEPKGDCSSDFVPDAQIYFRTLAQVASSKGFTEDERAREAPFFLVDRGARSAGSSWDILAAVRELASLAHGEKEAGMLESALAASLGISDSDRAFTGALRSGIGPRTPPARQRPRLSFALSQQRERETWREATPAGADRRGPGADA